MKKSFLSAFFVLCIAGFISAQGPAQQRIEFDTNQTIYAHVGDQYASSFGISESAEEETPDKDKKELKLEIPELSNAQKREKVFRILARFESTLNEEGLSEAQKNVIKDLELFYGRGENPQATLFNEINNTQTIFGEVALARMMSQPLTDVGTIKKRQALIKKLVEDEALFEQVSQLLNRVKESESAFFSYWVQEDPMAQEFIDKLYWGKWMPQAFNKNTIALEIRTRLGNSGTFWKIFSPLILFTGAKAFSSKMRTGSFCVRDSFVNSCKAITNFMNPKGYYDGIKTIYSDSFVQELRAQNIPEANIRAGQRVGAIGIGLAATGAGIIAASHGYATKVAVSHALQIKDGINYLQDRLIGVASIINAAKQMNKLASNDSVIQDGLFKLNQSQVLFDKNPNLSDDFRSLVNVLQTRTFKDSSSFFSISGRVLKAHNLMTNNKQEFAQVVEALGELDACMSAARLYKKHKNKRVGYCFAEFVEKDTPYLNSQDFWNPFVSPDVVVTNTLELGQSQDELNIILTGSNTGGKSTILKALIINLWMAYIFGLSPSKKLVCTYIKYLGTSLNINDDTAQGQSLFKSEALRAKSLAERVKSLKPDEFGFIVIDELFNGTASDKGASAARKFAQYLAEYPNVIFILATHFASLTELENQENGFINYMIEVFKDEEGNLIRPYKLEKGISQNNVADEILQEEMTDIDFINEDEDKENGLMFEI